LDNVVSCILSISLESIRANAAKYNQSGEIKRLINFVIKL